MSQRIPWYDVANTLRNQQGVTLQHIADRLGCHKSTVGHWLTGRNPAPLKAIQEIATMLGTTDIQLLANDPFYITDPQERAVIHKIRELPEHYRSLALSLIDSTLTTFGTEPPEDNKPPEPTHTTD